MINKIYKNIKTHIEFYKIVLFHYYHLFIFLITIGESFCLVTLIVLNFFIFFINIYKNINKIALFIKNNYKNVILIITAFLVGYLILWVLVITFNQSIINLIVYRKKFLILFLSLGPLNFAFNLYNVKTPFCFKVLSFLSFIVSLFVSVYYLLQFLDTLNTVIDLSIKIEKQLPNYLEKRFVAFSPCEQEVDAFKRIKKDEKLLEGGSKICTILTPFTYIFKDVDEIFLKIQNIEDFNDVDQVHKDISPSVQNIFNSHYTLSVYMHIFLNNLIKAYVTLPEATQKTLNKFSTADFLDIYRRDVKSLPKKNVLLGRVQNPGHYTSYANGKLVAKKLWLIDQLWRKNEIKVGLEKIIDRNVLNLKENPTQDEILFKEELQATIKSEFEKIRPLYEGLTFQKLQERNPLQGDLISLLTSSHFILSTLNLIDSVVVTPWSYDTGGGVESRGAGFVPIFAAIFNRYLKECPGIFIESLCNIDSTQPRVYFNRPDLLMLQQNAPEIFKLFGFTKDVGQGSFYVFLPNIYSPGINIGTLTTNLYAILNQKIQTNVVQNQTLFEIFILNFFFKPEQSYRYHSRLSANFFTIDMAMALVKVYQTQTLPIDVQLYSCRATLLEREFFQKFPEGSLPQEIKDKILFQCLLDPHQSFATEQKEAYFQDRKEIIKDIKEVENFIKKQPLLFLQPVSYKEISESYLLELRKIPRFPTEKPTDPFEIRIVKASEIKECLKSEMSSRSINLIVDHYYKFAMRMAHHYDHALRMLGNHLGVCEHYQPFGAFRGFTARSPFGIIGISQKNKLVGTLDPDLGPDLEQSRSHLK